MVNPETLHELLWCDAEVGNLFWRPRTPDMFRVGKFTAIHSCNNWNSKWAGREAFTAQKTGYQYGRIFDRGYYAHRVIWAMAHGEWPKNEIDHIDHDRGNNNLANLREATAQENRKNMSLPSDNTSGHIGVCWNKAAQKWQAQIKHAGKHQGLGRFNCITAAVLARKLAEKQFGFHENHGAN